MNPVRGIETIVLKGNLPVNSRDFQINESRSRDWNFKELFFQEHWH